MLESFIRELALGISFSVLKYTFIVVWAFHGGSVPWKSETRSRLLLLLEMILQRLLALKILSYPWGEAALEVWRIQTLATNKAAKVSCSLCELKITCTTISLILRRNSGRKTWNFFLALVMFMIHLKCVFCIYYKFEKPLHNVNADI